MLKFDTSKNQTNWAISANANDLVWLLLFISSLFILCLRLSGYPSRCPGKNDNAYKKPLQLSSIFFRHFFVSVLFLLNLWFARI